MNRETILHLAALSKLTFSAAELVLLEKDLNNMVAFVQQLQAVDTTNVAPLVHMSKPLNFLRADNVLQQNSREAVLQNAQNKNEAYIKVPKVINK